MNDRASLSAVLLVALAGCGNKSTGADAGAPSGSGRAGPPRAGLSVQMLDVKGALPEGVRKHQRVVGYTATTDVLTAGTPFCTLKQAEVECPPNVACDPPTALEVLCGEAAHLPAGKEGWYRSRIGFQATRSGCVFTGDTLCPPPGKVDAACTPADMLAVECTNEKLASGGYKISVPPFEYVDATGACRRFAAFTCTLGSCPAASLPEPTACVASP